ncbi:Cut9-interacting protein scn1 [Naganishia albida]|nr:Cut9-interacting protein scn1 [Naganishia albida]
MCQDHPASLSRKSFAPQDEPPEWQTIDLPDPAVLKLLVDVHCHPTDLPFSDTEVSNVGLGGLSAMATRIHDQELVDGFGREHGRHTGSSGNVLAATEAIACFGYHPWFCHLLSVDPEDKAIDKRTHYESIFIPPDAKPEKKASYQQTLSEILDDLPNPVRLQPLLDDMRDRIRRARENGQLVMVGEVGLDRSFRIPYPQAAVSSQSKSTSPVERAESVIATSGEDEMAQKQALPVKRKTLTPFTTSTAHQLRVLEMQFDAALEFGINVSLHSVKAQGETIKFLRDYKKKHGAKFEDRVNVDLHSCGGWSVESWVSESKYLKNLYTSPSLAISARTSVTPNLIRSADPTRLLVESDTHIIGDTTRRTWASAVWIAKCRGWRVERTEQDLCDGPSGESGVVTRLHANWTAFMKL